MSGFLVIGFFIILCVAGIPIAVSMALASIPFVLLGNVPLNLVAHRMINQLNSFPLLAVPMFILAANLMNTSGITNRLFSLARILVGGFRGGLAQVNILASLIFSGISGAALADVGGLGNIEIKAMKEQGYAMEDAAAITIASATIGPIFPPSIPLIIYGSVAEVSGVRLLISGVVPGILIAIALMIMVAIIARKKNYPRDTERLTGRQAFRLAIDAFPAALTPVFMLSGLLLGFFSPTEVAAITVFYALFLGVVVYRELKLKDIVKMCKETVRSTATIMFIVAAAALFAYVMTIMRLPQLITSGLLGLTKNPLLLLGLANVILLIAGMILEPIAAIMILTPILAPALTSAGVDPVHLGLVVVFNLMIGLLTPPVGMSLYMVSVISKVPVERVVKATIPYYIPLLVALALVTIFPPLATWLPNLIFNK
ncbi:MAG: TRAP transporter large permease [Treponemataceae bacterium]